jgi:hypothetical protein
MKTMTTQRVMMQIKTVSLQVSQLFIDGKFFLDRHAELAANEKEPGKVTCTPMREFEILSSSGLRGTRSLRTKISFFDNFGHRREELPIPADNGLPSFIHSFILQS